jgi:hypothetical protein
MATGYLLPKDDPEVIMLMLPDADRCLLPLASDAAAAPEMYSWTSTIKGGTGAAPTAIDSL